MATTVRLTELACYSSSNLNSGHLSLRIIIKKGTVTLGRYRANLHFNPASVLSSWEESLRFFAFELAQKLCLTLVECLPLAEAMARCAVRNSHAGILLLAEIEIVYPPAEPQAEFLDGGLILNAAPLSPVAEPVRRGRGGGLSEQEISWLKREVFVGGGGEKEVCSICLDDFRPGVSMITTLPPPCGHQFHRSCVATWLRRNPTCPMCRTPVVPTIN